MAIVSFDAQAIGLSTQWAAVKSVRGAISTALQAPPFAKRR